jgi:hypothetical protein
MFLRSVLRLLDTANAVPSSPILVTLMMEATRSSERPFLQEPHGVTSQKTAFFANLQIHVHLTKSRRLIIGHCCSCPRIFPSSMEPKTSLRFPQEAISIKDLRRSEFEHRSGRVGFSEADVAMDQIFSQYFGST